MGSNPVIPTIIRKRKFILSLFLLPYSATKPKKLPSLGKRFYSEIDVVDLFFLKAYILLPEYIYFVQYGFKNEATYS